MSKTKEVWATKGAHVLDIWTEEPEWIPHIKMWNRNGVQPIPIEASLLLALTGITLGRREAVQIRLSVEVIQRLKGGEG